MKRTIGIIFLLIIVLSGCTGKDDYYKGIEKKDISDLNDNRNLEYVNEYRGHTDNWAAVYIVYKVKEAAAHKSKMLLRYIGKNDIPPGKLSYSFDTEGGGDGSGTLRTDDSINGIYNLGSSESNGSVASPNSTVKMQVNWNENTETFVLKPILKK